MINTIKKIFNSYRFPLDDEKKLQQHISDILRKENIPHIREFELNKTSIIDFALPDNIFMEIKLKSNKKAIYRQVERYAHFKEVEQLILVTNTAMGFPQTINNKAVYVFSLGKAWL